MRDSMQKPLESYCAEVERTADEEGDFESPIILSEVKIHVTRGDKKEQIPVKLTTQLSDFVTLDIMAINSETNLF